MASLTIVVDGAGQRFPLESAAVTLGRGLESDIRLKDIKASRRHCQVVKTAKGYQCVDLSSGNGTYVNGVQIKSQMLSHGDKITVGSTTITFEEAPAAPPRASTSKPVSPKAQTSKLPVVAAPAAPAAAKPAPAKIPTERVQVAPTRRTTAKLDAVKPASQGGLRPASPPPSKSATRLHKPTGRTPSARPARPAADAPPRRRSALGIVGLLLVLGLAAGGGWMLFGPKDHSEEVRASIEQLMKKARDAESAEHYDVAVQEYRKAFELCQGERFKVRASEIQKNLQLIEARRPAAPSAPPRADHAPEKGPDFQSRKLEITGKYRLTGDPSAADWSGAIRDWSEFLKARMPGELKARAEGEVRSIQSLAKEDFGRLRKKAEALAQENKMAEALDLLKQQAPRFEATETQAELENAIKQYDR